MRWLLFAVLLTGCATEARRTYLPDGSIGYAIYCRGTGPACLERAGEICKGAGYDVLDADRSENQSVTAYGGAVAANTQQHASLMIRCRG